MVINKRYFVKVGERFVLYILRIRSAILGSELGAYS